MGLRHNSVQVTDDRPDQGMIARRRYRLLIRAMAKGPILHSRQVVPPSTVARSGAPLHLGEVVGVVETK